MKLWPRSLIARILLLELGAIVIVAAVLPMLLTWFLKSEAHRIQHESLTHQASAIADNLRAYGSRTVLQLPHELARIYASPYDGRAFVVVDGADRVVAASPDLEQLPWQGAPRADRSAGFRADAFVGISEPVKLGRQRLWVIVTQDQAGPGAILDDVMHAFVKRFDPVLIAVLLLLPLINSLLITRLVIAVRAASQRAETIGAQTLDARLEERGLPLEVVPLARATNDLLARLQASFRNQAEFVANVAHELRTPLAAHRLELDAVTDPAVRGRLRESADRLAHVVAQLQDLATLEGVASDQFVTFDAADLARSAVAEQAPAIFDGGQTIALEPPARPVRIRGDRVLAGLALANLIGNAGRHTPAGTTVRVIVAEDGSIAVRDDGPGIAASDPEQALQRYWRADRRRSDGAGLGLSIVRRIMEVHQGTLGVESQPGKGTCFTLRFPLAAAGVTSPS
jgi:signal transduction histidine kinase